MKQILEAYKFINVNMDSTSPLFSCYKRLLTAKNASCSDLDMLSLHHRCDDKKSTMHLISGFMDEFTGFSR